MDKKKEQPRFNPETELRSDLWRTLSLNDLWLQRILLNQRIATVQQLNNVGMAKQMLRGLQQLDVLIEEKSKNETDLSDRIVIR